MMAGLRAIESTLPPGFRFHPSDQELVCFYLRNKAFHHLTPPPPPPAAATMLVDVDLHECEPWELPAVAKLSSADEWYFFSCRDRKYATGSRRNRATRQGYWKATGKDKVILENGGAAAAAAAGTRKTLVFYLGRAPRGRKSGWVMHEFRLLANTSLPSPPPKEQEDWVLCRVFHKQQGNNGDQADQLAAAVVTTSPSSPSQLLHITNHQQQLLQADKLDDQLLLISSQPTTMSDQQDLISALHYDQHEDNRHILLDNHQQQQHNMMICRNDHQQQRPDQHLVDVAAMLQAPSLLELEQDANYYMQELY